MVALSRLIVCWRLTMSTAMRCFPGLALRGIDSRVILQQRCITSYSKDITKTQKFNLCIGLILKCIWFAIWQLNSTLFPQRVKNDKNIYNWIIFFSFSFLLKENKIAEFCCRTSCRSFLLLTESKFISRFIYRNVILLCKLLIILCSFYVKTAGEIRACA